MILMTPSALGVMTLVFIAAYFYAILKIILESRAPEDLIMVIVATVILLALIGLYFVERKTK